MIVFSLRWSTDYDVKDWADDWSVKRIFGTIGVSYFESGSINVKFTFIITFTLILNTHQQIIIVLIKKSRLDY